MAIINRETMKDYIPKTPNKMAKILLKNQCLLIAYSKVTGKAMMKLNISNLLIFIIISFYKINKLICSFKSII